ncbi:MAG: hypothetical protein U9O41_05155 [Candidatus Aerophobetes bacterium]|nr:hypothetical protein [Candidatus Aerophobetes bacterium]
MTELKFYWILIIFLVLSSNNIAFSEEIEKSGNIGRIDSHNSVYLSYNATSFVKYMNIQYEKRLKPGEQTLTKVVYGYGEMDYPRGGWQPYKKSISSIIGIGTGFKWYLSSNTNTLKGLRIEGSVNMVYISTSFKEPVSWPASDTEISGVLSGNIGYKWPLKEKFAVEILVGFNWPSLYPKPGIYDRLYPTSFIGFGLAYTF